MQISVEGKWERLPPFKIELEVLLLREVVQTRGDEYVIDLPNRVHRLSCVVGRDGERNMSIAVRNDASDDIFAHLSFHSSKRDDTWSGLLGASVCQGWWVSKWNRCANFEFELVVSLCRTETLQTRHSVDVDRSIAARVSGPSLSRDLLTLRRNNEAFADNAARDVAQLCFGTSQTFVHRLILVARSPVFAAMFQANSSFSENVAGSVTIDCDDAAVVHAFVDFLYSDGFDLNALADALADDCSAAAATCESEPTMMWCASDDDNDVAGDGRPTNESLRSPVDEQISARARRSVVSLWKRFRATSSRSTVCESQRRIASRCKEEIDHGNISNGEENDVSDDDVVAGSPALLHSRLLALARLGSMYQIDRLTTMCTSALEEMMDDDISISVLSFALPTTPEFEQLRERATRHARSNWKRVSELESARSIPVEVLLQISSNNNSNDDNN